MHRALARASARALDARSATAASTPDPSAALGSPSAAHLRGRRRTTRTRIRASSRCPRRNARTSLRPRALARAPRDPVSDQALAERDGAAPAARARGSSGASCPDEARHEYFGDVLVSDALSHIAASDATLARVVAASGPLPRFAECQRARLARHEPNRAFRALARAIVFQQLNGKAASTIFASRARVRRRGG